MKKNINNLYKLSKTLISAKTNNFKKQILKAFEIFGEFNNALFIILEAEKNTFLLKWTNTQPQCFRDISDKIIKQIKETIKINKISKFKQTFLCNNVEDQIHLFSFNSSKKKTAQSHRLIFGFLKPFKEQQLLKQFANLIFQTIDRINEEKKLKEENRKLKILLNSIPDIVCFKDEQGRWIEANKADLKLFKLQRTDYKGKKDSELVKYSPFFKEAFLTCEITDQIAMQRKRKSRSIEIIPQPNGTSKIFDVFKIPILNKDKSLKGLIVYGRDITRERKIEEFLQKQLTYSEKIISVAEQILKKQDKKEIMGYIVNELGKTLSLDQCYVFEYNAITMQISPIAIWKKEKNEPVLFKNKFSANYVKELLEHFKRNKNIIESHATNPHFLISNAKLTTFLHGKLGIKSFFVKPLLYTYPYMLFLGGFNLLNENKLGKSEKNFINTISKLVEVEIMKSAFINTIRLNLKEISKLASMIEQAQEIFILTDTKGKIEYVNPQFEKITGFSRYEVIDQNANILKSGKHPKKFYQKLWNTIKHGGKWEGKLINKKKNGELYTERAIIYPIKNPGGEIVKFCKIARDITKETILEERLRHAQKMESLATLASGIAHDFNNVITTILMNINMVMLLANNQPEITPYVENIKLGAEQASYLVKQILSFAKETTSEKEEIILSESIKHSLKLLKSALPKNIKLEVHLEDTPDKILANKGEIHQIFMNLCNNAIQAMEEKGGKLTVKLEKTRITQSFLNSNPGTNLKLNKEYYKLSIIDTGTGIPEEIRSKIFEPYFTTKGEKGTGLGLSIVHGIVTSYGGEILLKSEVGEGTVFEIFFPILKE